MTEEQGRRIEADLAVLERTARQLLQDIERLTGEVRGSGKPSSLQDSTPPAPSKRVLGVPEFAKVPHHAWISHVHNIWLIAGFLLAIALPPIGYLLHWQSGLSLGENRELAKPPAFGHAPPAELPAQIDAYYKDYFGFRKQLIYWNSVIERKWLGVPSNNVIIGKDGWLFVTDEGIVQQDFVGLSPYTPEELEDWKDYLEVRHEMLARRGVRYLFVIPPDKCFIYPEMLPAYFRGKAGRPRLDQLLSFLKATNSPVQILDLRSALMTAKAQGEVFFRQDSHWNGRGYLVGYQEICKRLQMWFPEIQPLSLGKDFELRPVAWDGGEWASLGLPNQSSANTSLFFFAKDKPDTRQVPVNLKPGILPKLLPGHRVIEMVQPNATHRLLVLHDSYMLYGFGDVNGFPFSRHFADSLYLGMFHLTLDELMKVVEYQHPDVVIEEIVQRKVVGTPERVVGAVAWESLSKSVRLSDRTSSSVLDNIDSVSEPRSVRSVHVPGNEPMVFTGWAIDEPKGTAAAVVYIAIDQVPYRASYGFERSDVADHFKTRAVLNSGFRVELPANTVPKGPHVVSLRTISADRKFYYQGPEISFTVD